MKSYLLTIWGDVEPVLSGPFETAEKRDAAAKAFRSANGDEHGLYMLDVDSDGQPEVDAYSGGFFFEEAEDGAEA